MRAGVNFVSVREELTNLMAQKFIFQLVTEGIGGIIPGNSGVAVHRVDAASLPPARSSFLWHDVRQQRASVLARFCLLWPYALPATLIEWSRNWAVVYGAKLRVLVHRLIPVICKRSLRYRHKFGNSMANRTTAWFCP